MAVSSEVTTALAKMAKNRLKRGFTFEDLVRVGAVRQASLSELAEWLAEARSSGFVDDMGFDPVLHGTSRGARRFRYRTTDPAASERVLT